jgi:hypothetical protein
VTDTDDDSRLKIAEFVDAMRAVEIVDRVVTDAEQLKNRVVNQAREARYQATITVACSKCQVPIGAPCNWGHPDFHWYMTHVERQIESGVAGAWPVGAKTSDSKSSSSSSESSQ